MFVCLYPSLFCWSPYKVWLKELALSSKAGIQYSKAKLAIPWRLGIGGAIGGEWRMDGFRWHILNICWNGYYTWLIVNKVLCCFFCSMFLLLFSMKLYSGILQKLSTPFFWHDFFGSSMTGCVVFFMLFLQEVMDQKPIAVSGSLI